MSASTTVTAPARINFAHARSAIIQALADLEGCNACRSALVRRALVDHAIGLDTATQANLDAAHQYATDVSDEFSGR